MKDLDPSLLAGFYCKDQTDFEQLYERFMNTPYLDTIISVAETAPVYSEIELKDIESDYEMC
jgi:hypothetical protein